MSEKIINFYTGSPVREPTLPQPGLPGREVSVNDLIDIPVTQIQLEVLRLSALIGDALVAEALAKLVISLSSLKAIVHEMTEKAKPVAVPEPL